jgi:2-keto-4-pentenoate hydratase/2-oxohepta-3-ene-1,7-dioic acid hydratase in catechol pathway
MTCDRYCCVAAAEWYRVLAQSEAGVTVDPRRLNSDVVWNGPVVPMPEGLEPRFIPWQDLDVPLPHRGARCWGYALTYPEHKKETLDSAHFRFLKQGTVESNSEPIPYRDFLDYELEIGVLMHRDTPDRFGYFLANDLTDRGLQIEHYDARNPAPGFTIAKDFPGSLRAGPLLAVGDASLWRHLTATLTLNGVDRQIVRAIDCHIHPRLLHDELFRDHEGDPWLLAATGTSSGTLFRTPRPREKVRALVAGGLSMRRARRSWLLGLKYLAPGDKVVVQSSILGRGESHVI